MNQSTLKGVEVKMKIEYMTIASQVTNSMQLELALTQEILIQIQFL